MAQTACIRVLCSDCNINGIRERMEDFVSPMASIRSRLDSGFSAMTRSRTPGSTPLPSACLSLRRIAATDAPCILPPGRTLRRVGAAALKRTDGLRRQSEARRRCPGRDLGARDAAPGADPGVLNDPCG